VTDALVDGFYEWQKTGNGKQPYYIGMEDGSAFAFAGLWQSWDTYGEEIRSCTILTTDANDLVEETHHRMPVILPPENYDL
jgi:putative SOS response-associated peptidase YedK